ncbi:MAG: cation:proton antiporter, partial [Myxococcota bacterium]
LGGRFLTRPAFRAIARTRLRELFVAAVLLLVIGIALLMNAVGLSPALGTFVAGVVLAESEYRHELESDIEPFKGLLLGLFFIAVGASVDFPLILREPATIAGLVVGLVALKWLVLVVVGRSFSLSTDQTLLFAFALAQGGEFAFVLFSFAAQSGVLEPTTTARLVAAVAVSMAFTPLLMLLFERVVAPRVGTKERVEHDYDRPEAGRRVIVAGYGRFGQICSRLLNMEGISATVLEADSDQVDFLRRMGREVYYGDASRYDLLEAAGAAEADLLILAVDSPAKTVELVHTAKKHFPNLKIMARARSRTDAYELLQAGIDHVYRETFDSALRMGTEALSVLGLRAHRAHRAAQRFRRRDEALMRELASLYGSDDFISIVRSRTGELEEVVKRERALEAQEGHGAGWDASTLLGATRAEFSDPGEDAPPS